MPADHKKSKYHVEIAPGIWIDTYDVARAYGITDPAHNHALKKVLVTGGRNEKGIVQDIDEAIWSLNNFKEHLGAGGERTTCTHDWVQVNATTSMCKQCGIEEEGLSVNIAGLKAPIEIKGIPKDTPRKVVGKGVGLTTPCIHMWAPLAVNDCDGPTQKCCICGVTR